MTIDIGLAKVLSLFQPQGTRQGLGSRHAVNGRLMDRNTSWHDSDFYKMLHYLDVFSHRSADRYLSKLLSVGEIPLQSIVSADVLLANPDHDALANVTVSPPRRRQLQQGRCILEGADDADIIRGFDRLDGLVARHVDELPRVLRKASQTAYRETRRYRTLQSKH